MKTKKREILELSDIDAWNIINNKNLDYFIIEKKIIGIWRWGYETEIIFRREKDGKFFKFTYRDRNEAFSYFHQMNYMPILAGEVFKTKKTIIVYE